MTQKQFNQKREEIEKKYTLKARKEIQKLYEKYINEHNKIKVGDIVKTPWVKFKVEKIYIDSTMPIVAPVFEGHEITPSGNLKKRIARVNGSMIIGGWMK